jgi:hypothetical protein
VDPFPAGDWKSVFLPDQPDGAPPGSSALPSGELKAVTLVT